MKYMQYLDPEHAQPSENTKATSMALMNQLVEAVLHVLASVLCGDMPTRLASKHLLKMQCPCGSVMQFIIS